MCWLSLDKALCEEVGGVFRAVSGEVGDGVLHDYLEHGRRGLKVIPGRMGLEHLHHCGTHTPVEREEGRGREGGREGGRERRGGERGVRKGGKERERGREGGEGEG